MNKKLLSLCTGLTLVAFSYASANVLVSEDWSGYTVGDSIGGSSSIWKVVASSGTPNIIVVDNDGTPAMHAPFDTPNVTLPYALLKEPLSLGTGLSIEVKTMMSADSASYLRFGFADPSLNNAIPSTNNVFNIALNAPTTKYPSGFADIQFGGGTELINRSFFTESNTPMGQWVTYRFDIVPLSAGTFELAFYSNGELLWKGTQAQNLFGSGEIAPFFGFRSAVDGYYGEITISQIPPIPEPSHFAIGAGALALLMVALRRRRS